MSTYDPLMVSMSPPTERYQRPRGTCPYCGSDEVTHCVTSGAFLGELDQDPPWVEWVHPSFVSESDRQCGSCGAGWNVAEGPGPAVRIVSRAGGAFGLIPVPRVTMQDDTTVDIELVAPDRLVRYLARPLTATSCILLGDAWMQAAQDPFPENTVATAQAQEAGLAVTIDASDSMSVTLGFIVECEPGTDSTEFDGVGFEVLRSDLVTAAHAIWEWAS